MTKLTLLLLFAIGFSSSFAEGISPLYYRMFAIGQVRARVQKICIEEAVFRNADALMSMKKPEPSLRAAQVQTISLQVLGIDQFTTEASNVPRIVEGEILDIFNPYPERAHFLKAGMEISVRIRLVLPEEEFNPADPRRQWWFSPPGEEKSISPPLNPANAIAILE